MGKGSWLLGCPIATPERGGGGGKKTSLSQATPALIPPGVSLSGASPGQGTGLEHHQAWSSPQLLERAWSGASYLMTAHLDRGH